jgi:hypothetical protein
MDIKFAEGIASSLHKIDAEGLREALQLTADDQTIDDKKFIELLVTKQAEIVRDRETRGFDRAKKDVLTKFEKDIRLKYGIEEDLKGIELIDKLVEVQKEEAGASAGKSKLNDDDVKKHPIYLSLEKTKNDELKAKVKEFEERIKADNESRVYEGLLSTMDAEADKVFATLGAAILPEDQSIAAKHKKRLLFDELRSFKWQKNGDDLIALKEDGSRLEDKAGNPRSFKDIVAEVAKANFQFQAAQGRKSPGNSEDKDDKGKQVAKKFAGQAPKDATEYVSLLIDPKITTEEKTEIKEVYGPQFANN